jgi:hypothetical protein
MALSRQPVIATIAMMRIPDESPNANDSKGINPTEPQIKATQPNVVSELPTFISNRQLNCFEVFTRNPKILVAAIEAYKICLILIIYLDLPLF